MTRRALALAALVGLGLLLGTPSAGAHALLRSSDPEGGDLLDDAPSVVSIDFTEPPDLSLSRILVLDEHGNELETGALERVSSSTEVEVSLPDLDDGVYTVSWRVLSTADGHVTAGSFSFGVGVEPGTAPAGPAHGAAHDESTPSALSVVGRWGFYWGLALLMGGALAGLYVFRELPRWSAALMTAGWSVAALGLIGMLLAERSEAGVSVSALLGSDRGDILITRGAGLTLAGAAAAIALKRRGRLWFGVLGVATAVAMLVQAQAGHAGAAASWRWAKVGTQWVHILAVGVWIGGLAWLLLGILGRAGARGDAVRRFSLVAGFALGLVAATGAVRALNEVGSVGALFDSGFGLSALSKTALFGGLVALGAYNRYRLVPAVEGGGRRVGILRRTVGSEVLIAAGVFGITGIMAGLVPPIQQRAAELGAASPERVVVTGSDFATTVGVRLSATPGGAGPNTFEVRVSDPDTGEPLEARTVRLIFALPEHPEVGRSELALKEEDAGTWVGRGTNLSVPGTWDVGVLIEQAADSLQVNLELATHEAEPEVEVIEGGPGEPDIYQIELEGGHSVQGFVDPGEPGANEVHFTFFDDMGGELPISEATIAATAEGEHPHEPEARRLGPGHFVASADLEPGTWAFAVEATTEDGTALSAEFEEEIE